MDHPGIEVRDTNHYRLALFAEYPFVQDEGIVVFEGKTYVAEKAFALPNGPTDYVKDHAIQIGSTTLTQKSTKQL